MTPSAEPPEQGMVPLDLRSAPWDRVFTIAPLVVVGSKEGDGYDLAPKHMAMPIGWEEYFGFACTPSHGTYGNVREHGAFTVSYPRPGQVVVTSLTASPREGADAPTPGLSSLPTVPAREIDGILLEDAHLALECELDRIIDGFGRASLIVGRVIAARAHPDALRASGVEDEELLRAAPLLAYLDPGRYAEVAASRPFPFPAGFRR